ncbi:catalytic protein [Hyaloscypha variabilis F]|uniref:Catalytic protein n=1 Tax=Hyaloscypha variabilis (strain UAMH 11265 / GT02V1 / F) TaxID=1149755 RepID=A0A2J6R6W3_HYAVF|nr:catalytic protein [Hyaloscypha variabilis F]
MILPISTLTAVPALFAASALAIPTPEHSTSPFESTTGFSDVTYSTSAGGYADCLSGTIQVPVTSTNQKLLFAEPADQYAVTASFVHFLQANSTQATEIAGGPVNVSETFNIAAKLCYPKNWTPSSSTKTIQFLTHGIGFNQSYWDFAQGYSFIDVAAQAGYPTFSHDRLGVGASDHPDPIQIVQAPIQVEIIHQLVSFLRGGKLAGTTFKNIVGVGHSFGSIQSVGVAAKYPKDFDGLVLTGFSTDTGSLQLTFADFNTAIARLNQPDRFGSLSNGYLVVDNAIANQFAFFYYPNFDVEIFLKDDASKQTYTYGEVFTLTSVVAPSPAFTGPVDAVIGEFDYIFAQGNASYSEKYYPANQAQLVQPALFPNASNGSQSYIVPGAGHAINLHYSAGQMFNQIQAFVKKNGF